MSHAPTTLRYLIRGTRLQNEQLARRAAVLTILLVSTLIVLGLAFCAVILSFLTGTNHALINRLAGITTALAITATLYIYLRQGRYAVAAYGVVGIYGALATVAAVQWSINLPSVSLLYCIVIVLSGIVLGARYSLYTTAVSAVLLFMIQLGTVHGIIRPNISWYNSSPHLIDLAIYYLVFTVLGVCSWLFNRQTDAALQQALEAERALQHEKDMLEVQVETRTRELQAAQIEAMGQLYRFAELGQMATGLLHDLANHMSTLSLDIEGMTERQRHSQLERRIKQRIQHIENMVHWAYEHINGKEHARTFNVRREIDAVVSLLRYDARRTHVRLRCNSPPHAALYVYGDTGRFRQLMTNLISNAIDAYEAARGDAPREVIIDVAAGENGTVLIAVCDHGVGIPKALQPRLFQPFYSTKHEGMGIGLFVVKQIAEDHFHGNVRVSSSKDETRFTVTLTGVARAA